ncbi:Os06g0173450 [Oryza sativa Japonica Group]|uniref:Os06g0173450 protein n=1 Tax=Oryza sativa subsp. japonica TaxID=39947 RepID=A0A0P0WTG4_ORYSJ|nr:hypothetical protein EE612_032208 [Oryza sativa]BAS96398.1 Os06g0173450 [Oryza sativa Japonica Group]
MRKLNLSVQTTRSHQSRIKNKQILIYPNLYPLVTTKSIELVQQFQHSPLNFSTYIPVKPLSPNGINLINENDAGSFLLSKLKSIPNQLCSITDKHLGKPKKI